MGRRGLAVAAGLGSEARAAVWSGKRLLTSQCGTSSENVSGGRVRARQRASRSACGCHSAIGGFSSGASLGQTDATTSVAGREAKNSHAMQAAGSCKKALAPAHESSWEDSLEATAPRRLGGSRGTRPDRTSAPHAKRRPKSTSRSSEPLIAPDS
eukprot:scaffold8150_cov116-Isochrysis_galbana.AAC.4